MASKKLLFIVICALVVAGASAGEQQRQHRRTLLAANGMFDRLEELFGEGADVTKRLAKGMERGLNRGAGGVGFAGERVSEAFSTVTEKASEAGHKLAELIKAPFRRDTYAPRLHQESGRPVGRWEESESEEDEQQEQRPTRTRARSVSAEDDAGSAEAEEEQDPAVKAAERQALQRAMAAERSAKRAAREAARSVARAARHTHGMRMEAFEVPSSDGTAAPTAGKASRGTSYSQAKRAALKAAGSTKVHSL